jgi:hypothetical protein
MKRDPELQKYLDRVAKVAFGRTLTKASRKGICVSCGKPVKEFKDELSRKEYEISGICQECQDDIF